MDVDFRPGRVDDGEGAALVAAMREEVAVLYDGLVLDGEAMPKAGRPSSGRRTAPSWSATSATGRCAAAGSSGSTSGRARSSGCMSWGPKQPAAQRMYELAGYRPIDNFNGNPVARFFGEKALL